MTKMAIIYCKSKPAMVYYSQVRKRFRNDEKKSREYSKKGRGFHNEKENYQRIIMRSNGCFYVSWLWR